MVGRLFTILSVLSLVLFLAVAGMWVRSYWRHDASNVTLSGGYVGWGIESCRGQVAITRRLVWPEFPLDPKSRRFARWSWTYPIGVVKWEPPTESLWNKAGFGFVVVEGGITDMVMRWESTYLPYWLPALIGGVLAARGSRRIMREGRRVLMARRSRRGLCPTCGYDLRATPERCPECGHVPKLKTAEAVA